MYPGRIIVTEPKGNVQPRISVDKYNARRVVLGEDVTLPCVAQGHPVPGYYWKRELQGQSVPVALGERLTILSAGLLRISKVSEKLIQCGCLYSHPCSQRPITFPVLLEEFLQLISQSESRSNISERVNL